jgi:hypothetical protein
MRTRSGSLAAVTARVPSHPAYAGLLCAFAERASGGSRSSDPAPETPAPEPDPGVVGGTFNTADGELALASVTPASNSAFGAFSQLSLTTGNFNTAVGALSLDLNNADSNTAVGFGALLLNTVGTGPNTGTQNTAVGVDALFNNTGGANDGDGSYNVL